MGIEVEVGQRNRRMDRKLEDNTIPIRNCRKKDRSYSQNKSGYCRVSEEKAR